MKDLEPELSEYLELPVLDQAGATALAAALMASVPARMPAEVRRVAQEMGAASQVMRDAWDEEPVPNLHDRRPADAAVDRAWAALHGRLLGYAGLPPERYPEAFEAGRLARALFPGGRWPWGAPLSQQWAESAERLALIAERGLEPRLVALAGPVFLAEVRRACQACAQTHGVDRLTLRLRAPGRPASGSEFRGRSHCQPSCSRQLAGHHPPSRHVVDSSGLQQVGIVAEPVGE